MDLQAQMSHLWTSMTEDLQQSADMDNQIVEGLIYSSEEEEIQFKWGGSRPGKAANINRHREAWHSRIWRDYFAETPVYGPNLFQRRYRMQRSLFLRILVAVTEHDEYFVQKVDALGTPGLSPIQKCTAALRMLAYGYSADSVDEYCRLAESTAWMSLRRFCKAVVSVFGPQYLRSPIPEDIEKQVKRNEKRDFPGMFGSIDCMHWTWKNCPVAWAGQFQGKSGERSIILEAVADYNLWIWHAYFGLPGSNNDLNVLDRNPLVKNLFSDEHQKVRYEICGKEYDKPYLLADGIYPNWSCFVKTIHEPQGEKRKYYAKMQEACRKDVERAFGVLQARFAIIKNPARLWKQEIIKNIMLCCVILHNMIIEDELEDSSLNDDYLFEGISQVGQDRRQTFEELCRATVNLEDTTAHFDLRNALIESLWEKKGNQN